VQKWREGSIIGSDGVYTKIQDGKWGDRGAGVLEAGREGGADKAYWVGALGGGTDETIGGGEGSNARERSKVIF
jgi:hypothetical protein